MHAHLSNVHHLSLSIKKVVSMLAINYISYSECQRSLKQENVSSIHICMEIARFLETCLDGN